MESATHFSHRLEQLHQRAIKTCKLRNLLQSKVAACAFTASLTILGTAIDWAFGSHLTTILLVFGMFAFMLVHGGFEEHQWNPLCRDYSNLIKDLKRATDEAEQAVLQHPTPERIEVHGALVRVMVDLADSHTQMVHIPAVYSFYEMRKLAIAEQEGTR
ncbi:hypothetical protein [Ferrimonas marina]|uniref:SMODS and SLOG-associating 2TM effector domain-containing protein n=1 Tax=Ferrimonas marina TaxID=299255 RepID=A0A1M5U791_9GAMM|nr:hypothetical protein [Ferrimonas marina]SHH58761.1 hypothetical protein SAMN02745129_2434 [Ferrimonas marina]